MTQENKELLIKDLCARLPYGVKLQCYSNVMVCIGPYTLNTIILDRIFNKDTEYVPFDEVKPYLFPLSSMTEEQKNEFNCLFPSIVANRDEYGFVNIISKSTKDKYEDTYNYRTRLSDWKKVIQWLLKNHFDIYGLIPMSLAIDATGLDIY